MIVYEIYDSRYIDRPDDAYCFEVCDTLQEAINNRHEYGNLNVIVETKLKKIGKRKYEQVSSKIVKL